jgi:predicted SAM-dependent methyltransferase
MNPTKPTHINIGCGTNILPDFANYDLHPSDKPGAYFLDITHPLPFETDSADFILIEHCLEHVNAPDGFRFMREACRVLKLDGVLRVCVPHLERVNKKKAADLIINHGHLMVYSLDSLVSMLIAAGFVFAVKTERKPCDGHWRVIGEELDNLETLRVEARV